MNRRRFASLMGAAVGGILAGSRLAAGDGVKDEKVPKHVCRALNDCKGQGSCMHGCGNNGCVGKNDCKGKGGCAAEAARHACKGRNKCKGIGGCATGDKGCAGKNSCKGRGGCEVPLKVEHTKARQAKASQERR